MLASLAACNRAEEPTAGPGPQTAAGSVAAVTPGSASEPVAEKRPFSITEHGDTRVDEYYWLRDDSRSNPEVLAYLEAENDYFKSQMEHTAGLQKTLFDEMTGRIDPDDSSVP
ncbi:MAG: oligopeptidase B, partial [Xanthomonadales bacterium]|nr:oligopeptidase B [Xanthomonadales bacterium]